MGSVIPAQTGRLLSTTTIIITILRHRRRHAKQRPAQGVGRGDGNTGHRYQQEAGDNQGQGSKRTHKRLAIRYQSLPSPPSPAAADGSRGIELSELLRVYPAAAMRNDTDAAMSQNAARQSEAAPPAAELRHAQDEIAALEDKIADMRAQLEAAQRRELWLQGQINQIQQRLLPPPRQGIIERIAEAIARLKRPKGNT